LRDWLRAQPARNGGNLPGRKPLAFCAFLFAALGMIPGDELIDLFPGTGIVSRAWKNLSRAARADTSFTAAKDMSLVDSTTFVAVDPGDALRPQLSLGSERRLRRKKC
jgi:hypothetical protein